MTTEFYIIAAGISGATLTLFLTLPVIYFYRKIINANLDILENRERTINNFLERPAFIPRTTVNNTDFGNRDDAAMFEIESNRG